MEELPANQCGSCQESLSSIKARAQRLGLASPQGVLDNVKDLVIFPKNNDTNGNLKQMSDMIRFVFLKDYSDSFGE